MEGFDAYGIVLRELYATRDRLDATITLLEIEKNNPTIVTPNTISTKTENQKSASAQEEK